MYQMQPDVLQSGVVQRSVSPYTVNKGFLQGPKHGLTHCSKTMLEHGFGMQLGQKSIT